MAMAASAYVERAEAQLHSVQVYESQCEAAQVAVSCGSNPAHGPSAKHCSACNPPASLCLACDIKRHSGKGPLSRHHRSDITHVECQGADCRNPAIVDCRDLCGKLCLFHDRERHSDNHFAKHPPREILQV
jgi:hypothetical protein